MDNLLKYLNIAASITTFKDHSALCELLLLALIKPFSECFMDLDKLNLVKLGYGGSVLGSSQFLLLPQLPQEMW